MRYNKLIFVVGVFFLVALVSAVHAGEYKIGPGDILDISVWKNPDLSKQVAVLPDGNIHFPLVKELKVEGLSVEELEDMLIGKLKKYVPEPDLFVSIVQVNSMLIYVIGKVNKPGRFAISKNIDVLQALAVAGGLNAFAKEKEIGIFRKANGKTNHFNFNYEEVSEGNKLEQNITLKRGDVIVVR
ncbi:MAG: polysaccharide export protein [Desulfobacteraceae bacterium]|nr:polysaccharide export protein [Desulfobacteraceae bacterium]